jgi:NAD(P)-dependent dehydrogenase (short-subunit alcohol dehydrogenase family)
MSHQNLPESVPAQEQSQQPGKEFYMNPAPVFIRDSYKGSGKLDGKVALISGGDSGIGRAVAIHFAREGADVGIIFLNERKDADKTKELVEAEGRECLLLQGDIGDEHFCRQAAEKMAARFKRIDILVNNAAEQHPKEQFEDITSEQVRKTFETNIFGYFNLTLATNTYLPEGARIINTTSVTAYRGSGHLIDYASTKGAIVSFTRSLAKKFADKNILVNGVAPGPIWTPLIPATFDKQKVEGFGENVLLKRPGQPAEVAPAYVFLACQDSSYITGQILHINGGEIVGA